MNINGSYLRRGEPKGREAVRGKRLADFLDVVRCKDCKHGVMSTNGDLHCTDINGMLSPKPDDYCSCGERKDGADNE